MNKPLIVKCNIMLLDAEIEAYRQNIIKQYKEDGVVANLCKHSEVLEILEKRIAELKEGAE